jgi:hypothetical protein
MIGTPRRRERAAVMVGKVKVVEAASTGMVEGVFMRRGATYRMSVGWGAWDWKGVQERKVRIGASRW